MPKRNPQSLLVPRLVPPPPLYQLPSPSRKRRLRLLETRPLSGRAWVFFVQKSSEGRFQGRASSRSKKNAWKRAGLKVMAQNMEERLPTSELVEKLAHGKNKLDGDAVRHQFERSLKKTVYNQDKTYAQLKKIIAYLLSSYLFTNYDYSLEYEVFCSSEGMGSNHSYPKQSCNSLLSMLLLSIFLQFSLVA